MLGAVRGDVDRMVTLVPAKQWHTCLPVATHLFSPPSLRLYPSIRTGAPVLYRTLSPSATHTVRLSLASPIGQGYHFEQDKGIDGSD